MLQYNTHRSSLPMPEYGRNVQQMIEHCISIEDRDERNACARVIIDTICRLNPRLRTSPEWRAKLWDHLAIMSDFKLDIDYPTEPISPETLNSKPNQVEIPQHYIALRVYGANIIKLIDTAVAMPKDDPDRAELELLIAYHMKKLLMLENPEVATDKRVFADLAQISEGHIVFNPDETHLRELEMPEVPSQNKKKRRNR